MALDHYVPQVHLKHFCLPVSGRLLAFRKSDGKTFEPKTDDVCRIEEGNTNSYLREDRVIEDFLKSIEPNYNAAIRDIQLDSFPHEAIYVLAGFASSVYSCSPTGMRLGLPQLKTMLEATAEIADKHGEFGVPPSQLGGSSVTELLQTGKIKFTVDPKYPQAVNISGVIEYVRTFGNSAWEILVNAHTDSPFLTSDFPFALEQVDGPVQNRIVPLTPTLALRIIPSIEAGEDKEKFDLRFPGFRWRRRNVSRGEVAHANRLIVRCAEDLVFCSGRFQWVEAFVRRNSRFMLDTTIQKIATGDGTFMVAAQRIIERGTTPASPTWSP
jgi:hypothetical protein